MLICALDASSLLTPSTLIKPESSGCLTSHSHSRNGATCVQELEDAYQSLVNTAALPVTKMSAGCRGQRTCLGPGALALPCEPPIFFLSLGSCFHTPLAFHLSQILYLYLSTRRHLRRRSATSSNQMSPCPKETPPACALKQITKILQWIDS